MRALILPVVTLIGCMGLAVPAQTAPVAPKEDLSVSAINMVRQRCGQGMKRSNVTQDKQGAWHGPCVPKRGASPNSNIANQSDTANELNAQEAARKAGGAR
jgi:hypothetical protein